MRMRAGPILAAALLAGLGIWTYVEFSGERERSLEEEAQDRVLRFDRGDLESIRIRNEHGEVALRLDADSWSIAEPLATAADQQAVEALIGSLESALMERRISGEGDLKQYGLDPPLATLTIRDSTATEPRSLGLGRSNPVGGARFALLPGSHEVALVSASLAVIEEKDLLSLRDKSLLRFDPWKVDRLRLERGGTSILLEKPDEGWQLREPVEAPADGPAVTGLLTALDQLRARRFVSENPESVELSRYGLNPPQAVIAVRQEGWGEEKRILVGIEEEGSRYARTVGRGPVVAVPNDFWDKVTTSLFALRRKDLLGFSQYRVRRIRAEGDGEEPIVLTRRKEGDWSVSGRAEGSVKAESIDLLLRMIADLKAEAFDDEPADGLRSSLEGGPALALTLEEEPDAAGGSPRSQRLLIGRPDPDGRLPVQDSDWRPIAWTRGDLDGLQQQIDAIAEEASHPPPGPTEPEASRGD